MARINYPHGLVKGISLTFLLLGHQAGWELELTTAGQP